MYVCIPELSECLLSSLAVPPVRSICYAERSLMQQQVSANECDFVDTHAYVRACMKGMGFGTLEARHRQADTGNAPTTGSRSEHGRGIFSPLHSKQFTEIFDRTLGYVHSAKQTSTTYNVQPYLVRNKTHRLGQFGCSQCPA